MQTINVIYNSEPLKYNKNIRINKEQILFTSIGSMTNKGVEEFFVMIQVGNFEFRMADDDFKIELFASIDDAEKAIRKRTA